MHFSSISFTLEIPLIIITILSSFDHTSPDPIFKKPRSFDKIYAFGDSFTDTGNTKSSQGLGGFRFVSSPPYGTTFFHHPTYRYSDGRLVIDFLAESLSLPYLPPYLEKGANRSHGINFAVAGATAIDHDFFVKNNVPLLFTPQSLKTQYNWFEKFLESKGCRNSSVTPQQCKAVFDNALIWVGEIGVNDYAYTRATSISDGTIRNLTIKSVTEFLQALLNKGAKYVIAQGMPPTGCLTLSMEISNITDRDAVGCVRSINALSDIHNKILQANIRSLQREFPNAVIAYADYYNAYRYVMKNAENFTFNHMFRACCGSGGGEYNFVMLAPCGSFLATSCTNPSQYINWDGVHLTEAMYKAISELFFTRYMHPSFRHLLKHKTQYIN